MGKPRDTKIAILPSTTRKGTTLSTSAALDSPSVIDKLVSPPHASRAGTSAESENSHNIDNVSAVLDDSGSLGSFLDATIAKSRQIENTETPNATTPVKSPELDYSSDDLDEDYVELDDDFIEKCNATTDARKIKKLLAEHAVRYKPSPDPKFATSPINIRDKDYDFSLDLSHIAIVEKTPFCGTEKESDVEHMTELSTLSGVFSDDVKMRTYFVAKIFPFSLKDDAKTWYNNLPPGSIKSPTDLRDVFFRKYFPASAQHAALQRIYNFDQEDGEKLPEAWARFCSLIRAQPDHDLEKHDLLDIFYSGLTIESRAYLDSCAGCVFRKRTPDDAEELLAKIGRNHDDWSTPEPTPTPIVKKRGMIKLNDEDMREAKKSLKEKGIKPEDVKNLPPIEDICETIPPSSMIEYMKDIVTNKRKIPNEEISTMLANYSFNGKIPKKLGDPAIRVPQWGSCEKIRGTPRELSDLYTRICNGRSFSNDGGPALGTHQGEIPFYTRPPLPYTFAAPQQQGSPAYVVYKVGGDPGDYQFLYEPPKEIPHGYVCTYVPDCNNWMTQVTAGRTATAGGVAGAGSSSGADAEKQAWLAKYATGTSHESSTSAAPTVDQITAILRDQFGILPKKRMIGYSKPYPNEYDLIPLPPKYRLPDFTKFSGSEGSSSIEHVSRYLAQLGMVSASDQLRVRFFSQSLTGPAFGWYTSLPPDSVRTWKQLEEQFHIQYHSEATEAGIADLTQVRQRRGETVSEYIQRFRTVRNRCYSKLTSYEQRHPELYQDKFKRVALIEMEEDEDSAGDQEVAVAEWARGAVPVSCKWVKQPGPAKGFDFDLSKTEQIFDLLLKEKQLKLPEGHKIPTLQEMNGRPYCKWHHTFTHATNDCKVLRGQIQMAIEQGRLLFGLVDRRGKDKPESSHSRGKDKEEADPRDRPQHDDRRYLTEEEVRSVRYQRPLSAHLLNKYEQQYDRRRRYDVDDERYRRSDADDKKYRRYDRDQEGYERHARGRSREQEDMDRHWNCPFFKHCWDSGMSRLPTIENCPECRQKRKGTNEVSVFKRLGPLPPQNKRAESSQDEDFEESEEEDRYHRPRWCPDGLSHSQKRRVQRLRNLEEAETQYLYTLRKARLIRLQRIDNFLCSMLHY
ncbi:hypothetical protein QYE76_022531 [Lolium multiflorum]|uniref:Retrotransposon gag domain-containing protein n=1 Tax=Lolium multiflorum TaxID=4521 RepID=A0AAD8VRY8_LOLMU|nr:hypothetical protein QYE76_022531 [Lolium multiflorum]